MKLRITHCTDPMRWYSDKIGEVFDRIPDSFEERNREYKVRTPDGTTNFIQWFDCEVVEDE